MSETQWAEDGQDKPMRKQLPKWVWFCGAGCLLALIAVVGIVWFGVQQGKKFMDTELGWTELQQILPADDVHPQHVAHALPNPMMTMVQVVGPGPTMLQFQQHKGHDAEKTRRELFESEKPQFPENLVVMKFTDLEKMDVVVQGRSLHAFKMKSEITGFMRTIAGKEADKADQYMILLDVTPEGRADELVLLTIQRAATLGPFTDDDLAEQLAPFHIGPNR